MSQPSDNPMEQARALCSGRWMGVFFVGQKKNPIWEFARLAKIDRTAVNLVVGGARVASVATTSLPLAYEDVLEPVHGSPLDAVVLTPQAFRDGGLEFGYCPRPEVWNADAWKAAYVPARSCVWFGEQGAVVTTAGGLFGRGQRIRKAAANVIAQNAPSAWDDVRCNLQLAL